MLTSDLLRDHFQTESTASIVITERKFPYHVRADVQQAMNRLVETRFTLRHFSGVRREYEHSEVRMNDCLFGMDRHPVYCVPPEYDAIDVGESKPLLSLKTGLWLLEADACRLAVLMRHSSQFQIATTNDAVGRDMAAEFFAAIEVAVREAKTYRGKILSLERSDSYYRGQSIGLRVHRLRHVNRADVILPRRTLDLLDRNVIEFTRQRSKLREFRQSTRKGLLFYGPPGTGKTHTIHYLAAALEGHTTLLVTAEEVYLLHEYMTLARLLQPSIVVMEDVDLIARDRASMHACEEASLNKLLNEMDGLREEADILFLLTTNRPEKLEAALASRPGRVDQAIEFPFPDEEGREKLVRLYSQGLDIAPDVVSSIVTRATNVSAAFIKELMRRSVQFHLEHAETGQIALRDVDRALEEMLFSGGSLNLKLLGAKCAAT